MSDYLQNHWQHNPSKVYPFKRCFELHDGEDRVTVDYDPGKKLARIGIRRAMDGMEYYSIVKNGIILRERNADSEQPAEFENIVGPYKALINTLPNNYVLGIIGGVYGLKLQSTTQSSRVYISPFLKQKKPRTFREWFYYYFFGRRPPRKKIKRPLWPRIKARLVGDSLDVVFASVLAAAGIYYLWDHMLTGAYLATFGISTGFIDWLVRRRNPLILKIIMISAAAGYLYFYGYMYT